jgi:hypothetical protein
MSSYEVMKHVLKKAYKKAYGNTDQKHKMNTSNDQIYKRIGSIKQKEHMQGHGIRVMGIKTM